MSTDGRSAAAAARRVAERLASRLRAARAGGWTSGDPGDLGPGGWSPELETGQARPSEVAAGATAASASARPGGQGGPGGRGWPDGSDGSGGPGTLAADAGVPRLLRQVAAWSWRLILVAAVAYLLFKIAVALRLLVIPLIAAMLLCALLQPLTALLRRAGMPSLAATWCTVLATIAVLGGAGTLITNRVQADYPRLAAEVRRTVHGVQVHLAGPPFRLNGTRLNQLTGRMLTYLSQHKSLVAGTVLTGGKYALEVLTALILTIFITFFLLKDGAKIWSWLISGLRPEARARANRAGVAGWQALVSYIRGTTVVAAIHALFIGLALWLLGVPLLVPLVILVFIAAYIPLIGILVVGALAIIVTLATQGYVAALILIAVFLVENQIESHLLQPLVVGRIVKLHPLAIIVVLAVGGIVAGIPGAIVAVPAAAVVSYAWPYLRDHPEHDSSDAARERPEVATQASPDQASPLPP